MSVLVLVEHTNGVFKKKSLEAIQYGAHIAKETGVSVTAVAMGNCGNDAMQALGAYGAAKVLHTTDNRLDNFNSNAYTRVMLAAAQKESAKVIVGLHDTTGKAVTPRLAARLKAGLVAGAVGYPDLSKGFVVKKNVFSGKAFAYVNITSDIKVINLMPNTFPLVKGEGIAAVENLDVVFEAADFSIQVTAVEKARLGTLIRCRTRSIGRARNEGS